MINYFLPITLFLALCSITSETSESVTYPGIGTFNKGDFFDAKHRPVLLLPLSPETISPKFELYTRKLKSKGETIVWNNSASARDSSFDGKKMTKVITHGFIDNSLVAEWMIRLKDRYLDYEDVNVLLVYWPRGNIPPYSQATVNTRVVGAMLALQVNLFCNLKRTTPASFHLIGHSLGAHIAGYAGKFLGSGILGRITGLDPAGPLFEGVRNPAARLWPSDALFVDAIHTDARPSEKLGIGMFETCTHVDIYPNSGEWQPGCDEERVTTVFNTGFDIPEAARRLFACNHQRAVDYFIDSLETNIPLPKAYQCESYEKFKAGQCLDCGEGGEWRCAILGPRAIESKVSKINLENVDNVLNGRRFFIITKQHEPFLSKYQYILILHFSSLTVNQNPPKQQFTQLAVLHVHLIDSDDNKERFSTNELNNLKDIFQLGHSYSYTGVMGVNPKNVKQLIFKWDHLVDVVASHLLDGFMYIRQIEVVGLTESTSTVTSKPTVLKFCNRNSGIKSKVDVPFDVCLD